RTGDRVAHRFRDARDRARTRPAWRIADGAGSRARDALRPEGGRPRTVRAVRPDGGVAGRRHRRRLARGGDGGAEDGPARVVRGGAGIFRLAAIDLDGTLLRSDGTIGERTKRAIRETSLDIVLVTARGPL